MRRTNDNAEIEDEELGENNKLTLPVIGKLSLTLAEEGEECEGHE